MSLVETVRVAPESFQAELGAEVDGAPLVLGTGKVFQAGGDGAPADGVGAFAGFLFYTRDAPSLDDLLTKSFLDLIQGYLQAACLLRAILPKRKLTDGFSQTGYTDP